MKIFRPALLTLAAVLLVGVASRDLFAQSGGLGDGVGVGVGSGVGFGDVERLGFVNGTQPPPAYFDELRRDPSAFDFSVGGQARLLGLQEAAARDFQAIALQRSIQAMSLGPLSNAVAGTIRFPLVLGLFSDTPAPPPYSSARVQTEFFSGPNSNGQTITEFYAAMSRGMLNLVGEATSWIQTPWTEAQITLGQSALVSSTTGGMAFFIEALVAEMDAKGMDWSAYDRTGDGFVDLFTVLHPSVGGECRLDAGGGSARIWSHRWSVSSASRGRLPNGVRTQTPGPGPSGFIHVNDYTVQPLMACGGGEINQIGVFAHELGHAFGLPDLYSTNPVHRHAGAGNWDLMATGSWGCGFGRDPARPCAMGAWSRSMLGWVDLQEVPLDADAGLLTLPPSVPSGRVLRVPAGDGSGTYLLIENRQNTGVDQNLFHSGLLVWQVNPAFVLANWSSNQVNADPDRMGVQLRSADDLGTLLRPDGLRGSPGDPFPGCVKGFYEAHLDPSIPCAPNRAFHAGTLPASVGPEGHPFGITITAIEEVGVAPHDVRFRMSTRWSRMGLAAQTWDGPLGTPLGEPLGVAVVFTVNGVPRNSEAPPLLVAPYQSLTVIAGPGAPIEEGVRVGFQRWEDGSARVRTVQVGPSDTTLVATYGGREVRVRWISLGGAFGVAPGELLSTPQSPDLWFPLGSSVQFEARPQTGFRFAAWVGAFAGASNPLTLTLDAPVDLGAQFELSFGFEPLPPRVDVEGGRSSEITFTLQDATLPLIWTLHVGVLPEGLQFSPSQGAITGSALEVGAFPVQVRVQDQRGLQATADLVIQVTPPRISGDVLAGPYLANGLEPSVLQKQFLDWNGNRDGFYDLGDLRAYLMRFGLPTGLAPTREAAMLRTFFPMGFEPGPESRDGGVR